MLSEKHRLKSRTWKVYLSTVKMYFHYFPHQRQMMWNASSDCSQSEMSHQRCFRVSETCLYKVYPFFMTSYWSKSKKTVQNLSFWLVDIIFSKKIRFVCFCCHALYLSVLNMHVSAEPERFYTYHICKERWAGPPFMLLYCIPQV